MVSRTQVTEFEPRWRPPVLEVEISQCPKCGYRWQYKGNRMMTTCPSCTAEVVLRLTVWEEVRQKRRRAHIEALSKTNRKWVKCHCGYEWYTLARSYRARCSNCKGSIILREKRPFNGRPTKSFKCSYCGVEKLTTQIHKNSVTCSQCGKSTWVGWSTKIQKPGISVCCVECKHTWNYRTKRDRTVCPGCSHHNIILKGWKDKYENRVKYTCVVCGFEGLRGINLTHKNCGKCGHYIRFVKPKKSGSKPLHQLAILYYLKNNPMKSTTEIASELSLLNKNTGTILSNLLRKGLVEKHLIPNPNMGVWGHSKKTLMVFSSK